MGIAARNAVLPKAAHSVDLANRIRAGDQQAECEFAEKFSSSVLLTLLRHTRDPEIARDCCQKTLLIALSKMRAGEILKPQSLAAFLRCTAANVLITHFRTEKRYANLGDGVFRLRGEPAEAVVRDLDSETVTRLLNSMLDELPMARDREILRRFYLQEEDKQSICADLELKPAHFDRVLYRARKRVRRILLNHEDVKAILFKSLEGPSPGTGRRIAVA